MSRYIGEVICNCLLCDSCITNSIFEEDPFETEGAYCASKFEDGKPKFVGNNDTETKIPDWCPKLKEEYRLDELRKVITNWIKEISELPEEEYAERRDNYKVVLELSHTCFSLGDVEEVLSGMSEFEEQYLDTNGREWDFWKYYNSTYPRLEEICVAGSARYGSLCIRLK